ncbi:MAG: hypothetical protein COB37_07740 [Kordiimonadales bacterium]|nr:MAG: hypothetical protein COB37_07740 [Kordiimonadales bacterium]
MKKFFKIFGSIIALLFIVPISMGLILRIFSSEAAAPGVLVSVGSHKLHIHCTGTASDLPTVIIESGAGTQSTAYYWLQKNLAETTKVCSYDRAGLGWSEESNLARDSETIANQLHTLLDNAKIKRPFVFAGHSIAGIHMRVYVEKYPNDVAGIAFLDASHPDQVETLGMGEDNVEAMEAGVSVLKVLMNLGLTRLYNPLTAGLPLEQFPEEVANQFLSKSHDPEILSAAMAEMADMNRAMDQARSTGTFGSMPIVVITAAQPVGEGVLPDGLDPIAFGDSWKKLQRDIATLSTDSKHVLIETATHMSLVTDKRNADEAAGYVREILTKSKKLAMLAE